MDNSNNTTDFDDFNNEDFFVKIYRYIWDGFMPFIDKNPLYFVCSLIYYMVAVMWFGWHFGAFIFFAVVYILSIALASSPLGEKLFQLFNHVRRLETAQEKQLLSPLFGEVYGKAKAQNPNLPEIDIYIIDSMSVDACAMGSHTVAVTKGAIHTFSEAELKAVLSHEIAHILNKNTTAQIYTMIGNGIFTFLLLSIKLLCWLCNKIDSLKTAANIVEKIFDGLAFVFLFLMQIALAVSDRQAERRADEFAITLGYGEDMVQALYLLEKMSLSGEGSIIEKLLAHHPRVTSRIENLEIKLGLQ